MAEPLVPLFSDGSTAKVRQKKSFDPTSNGFLTQNPWPRKPTSYPFGHCSAAKIEMKIFRSNFWGDSNTVLLAPKANTLSIMLPKHKRKLWKKGMGIEKSLEKNLKFSVLLSVILYYFSI